MRVDALADGDRERVPSKKIVMTRACRWLFWTMACAAMAYMRMSHDVAAFVVVAYVVMAFIVMEYVNNYIRLYRCGLYSYGR